MSKRSRDYYRVDQRKRKVEVKTKKLSKSSRRPRPSRISHKEAKLIASPTGQDLTISDPGVSRLHPSQVKAIGLIAERAINKPLFSTDGTAADEERALLLIDPKDDSDIKGTASGKLLIYIDDLKHQHPRMKGKLQPIDEFSFSLSEEMRFALRLFEDARLVGNKRVKKTVVSYIGAIADDMDIAREKHLESLGIILSTDDLRKINRELKTLQFDKADTKTIDKLTKLADSRTTKRADRLNDPYDILYADLRDRAMEFAEIYKSIQLELVRINGNSKAKKATANLQIALDGMLSDLQAPPVHFHNDNEKAYLEDQVFELMNRDTEIKLKKLLEQENMMLLSPILADETHRNIMSGTQDEALDIMSDLTPFDPGSLFGGGETESQLDKRAHRKIIFKQGAPNIDGVVSKTGKYIIKTKENNVKPIVSKTEFMRTHAGSSLAVEDELTHLGRILDSEGYNGDKVVLGLLAGKVKVYEENTRSESAAFASLNALREKYMRSQDANIFEPFKFKDVGTFNWGRINNSRSSQDAIDRYFNPFVVYDATNDEFVHGQGKLNLQKLLLYGIEIGLVEEVANKDETKKYLLNGAVMDMSKPESARRKILKKLNADKTTVKQFHNALIQKSNYWSQGDILRLALFFGWDYSRNAGEQRQNFLAHYLDDSILDQLIVDTGIKSKNQLEKELAEETALYEGSASGATETRFTEIQLLNSQIDTYEESTTLKIGDQELNLSGSKTDYIKATLLDFKLPPVISHTYRVLDDDLSRTSDIRDAKKILDAEGDRAIVQLDRVTQQKLEEDIAKLYKITNDYERAEFMRGIGEEYDIPEAKDYNETRPWLRGKPEQIEKRLREQAVIALRDPNDIEFRNKTYFALLRSMFVSILSGKFNLQDKMKKDAIFRRDVKEDPTDAGLTTISDPLADYGDPFDDFPQISGGLVTPESIEELVDEAIELENDRRKPVPPKPKPKIILKPIKPRTKINRGIKRYRRPSPHLAAPSTIARLNGNLHRVGVGMSKQVEGKDQTPLETELRIKLGNNAEGIKQVRNDLNRKNVSEAITKIKLQSAKRIMSQQEKDLEEILAADTRGSAGGLQSIPRADVEKLLSRTRQETKNLKRLEQRKPNKNN